MAAIQNASGKFYLSGKEEQSLVGVSGDALSWQSPNPRQCEEKSSDCETNSPPSLFCPLPRSSALPFPSPSFPLHSPPAWRRTTHHAEAAPTLTTSNVNTGSHALVAMNETVKSSLFVTLRRSFIRKHWTHRRTCIALGLKGKIGQTVHLPNNVTIRKSIEKVRFLVDCEISHEREARLAAEKEAKAPRPTVVVRHAVEGGSVSSEAFRELLKKRRTDAERLSPAQHNRAFTTFASSVPL